MYLENIHRLWIRVDQSLSLLKIQVEKEIKDMERKLEEDNNSKLIKETKKKQKVKYLNDILHLFNTRDF